MYYTGLMPNNGDVVSCILTSNAACSTNNTAISNSINIIVNPVLVPSAGITASSTAICTGMPVTFTASAVNCGNSPRFNWMLNGSSTGTNSTTYTSNTIKNGDSVTCLVTTDNIGCYATTNTVSNAIIIKVSPVPVVSAGRDTLVFKGSSFKLNGYATGNIAQYIWSPTIYLSNSNVQNPIVTPLATTKYTLRVISTFNCEATVDITVKVLTKIIIPNTFTPNGDGINDTWAIAGLEDYAGATIEVYNRYGQQVFRTAAYKQWDGTSNSKPLPLATYYYVINPKNNVPILSGWVAIIR